jgi:DNA-binding response OmpR family regulator
MATNGKKILIVEDDRTVSDIVAAALKGPGDTVFQAETIAGAEETLLKGRVDIIILDRILPDGDGILLFRQLKANPLLKRIPVLVLSGRDAAEEQSDGLDTGADDYVTKPFNVKELQARVHALLRRAGNFTE